jgi:hypothetical protein
MIKIFKSVNLNADKCQNQTFFHYIKLNFFEYDCEVRKSTKPKIEEVFVYHN